MDSRSLPAAPRDQGLEIEMHAQEIMTSTRNATDACKKAEADDCKVTQDWTGEGSTSYLFEDESVLVVSGSQVNAFDTATEAAEDWYNGTKKSVLLDWAAAQGLDIGQEKTELDEDWNERIISAYAKNLAA